MNRLLDNYNQRIWIHFSIFVIFTFSSLRITAQDNTKPTIPVFDNMEVNPFNGNLIYTRQDFVINGNLPVIISFYYNSVNDTVDSGYGNGWYFNYGMNYYFDSLNNVVIIRNGGRKDLYSINGDQYLPPTGVMDQLTEYETNKFQLTTKEGIKFDFADPTHKKLTGISDKNGNSITITYTEGFPTTISNSSGGSATLTWAGRHLTRLIFSDASYVYAYDKNNLIKVTNPKGFSESYQYFPNGKMSVIADYNNNPVYIEYAGGVVVSRIKSCLSERSFSFVGNKSYIIENGSSGKQITCYTYDDYQRVIEITNPDQRSAIYEYDSNNNVVKFTDFEGKSTLFSYDGNGNLLSSTSPEGSSEHAIYNADNQITRFTDTKGNTTNYSYDDKGNLEAIYQPLSITDRFLYDNTGNITRATDPLGQMTNFVWDQDKNLVQIAYPIGSVNMVYDNTGNLTEIKDPNGNSVFLDYGGCTTCRQITKVQKNDTIFTTYSYDGNGNLVKETDANGNDRVFGYDGINRLSSVTIPAGTTKYSYDEKNNLTTVTDANSHSTQYAYNTANQVVTATDPLDNAVSFSYDANGNLLSETDPVGNTIRYLYDSDNRLVEKSYPGNTDYFSYDAAGNIIQMQNSDISISYRYDEMNRLLSKSIDNWNKTISYEYDKAGNRVSMTDPDGNITNYRYDANNRLTEIINPFDESTSFDYDLGGRLTKQTNANGTLSEFAYDQSNLLTTLINKKSTGEIILAYKYTYDRFGNRLSMTVNDTALYRYTYDASHRLTQVISPDGEIENFRYDGAGNRISYSVNDVSRNYMLNEADQLLSDGNAVYTYDANGNMTSKTEDGQTTVYQYNALNRLIRIEYPDGTWNSFVYDPAGNRISTTSKAGEVTRYFLDGDNVLMELNDMGITEARYTSALGIDSWISMHRGNQSYVFHKDGLNSTSALSDATASVCATYTYSAFGEIKSSTGVIENPYTYTGREYDYESGQYYYRTRYYNAKTGRFITKDLFKGFITNPESLNNYVYVNNNPVNKVDPMGLWVEESLNIVLSTISAGGVIAATGVAAGTIAVSSASIGAVVAVIYAGYAIGASSYNLGLELVGIDYKAPTSPFVAIAELVYLLGGTPNREIKKYAQVVDLVIPLAFGMRQRKYKGMDKGTLDNLIKNWQHLPRYLKSFTFFSQPMYLWKKLPRISQIGNIASIISKGKLMVKSLYNLFNILVIRPVDPNEIIGPPGYDTIQWVSANNSLEYKVLFENSPDFATAPAQNVLIKVPVMEKLNLYDFRVSSFGFGGYIFEVPENSAIYTKRLDLRDSIGLYVDVTAGINVTTHEAFWSFVSIDPATGLAPDDPTKGFLPVNDSTLNGAGEGFVNFIIKPKSTVHTLDSLIAIASIVFDNNDPLLTNTWINIADALPPVSTVDSIRSDLGVASIDITFTGHDDPGGCGISSYQLYFSKDDEPYLFYGTFKPDTIVRFTGSPGSYYKFLSRARDFVGNIESMKSIPDVSVTIQDLSRDAPITYAGTVSACPGTSVSLPITVKNFANVSGISLRLDYNPQLMTFSSYAGIHPVLSGLLINDNPVSDTLHKIMISWTSVSPVSLVDEDTLLNLNFTFLSGNAILEFNNISNGGQDCEYADENAYPMNDNLTADFYYNGQITDQSPGSPVLISGHTSVQQCSEGIIYSVDPVAGASSYWWTLPNGATGTSTTNSIMVNYGPMAVSGTISVKGLNDCGYGKESSLYVTVNSPFIQNIDLTIGWNIFSANLNPCYPDMEALSQTMILEGSLVKIQDETGNSLEDMSLFGGWTNNIGSLLSTEGYKIKVTHDCQLQIPGVPVILPVKIPLKMGWNIIGFPRQSEANALGVLQQLIDRKTLLKVQDETGNAIEDLGVFGSWQNFIGNFKPGEGYKVKVGSPDTLTILESYSKSGSSLIRQIGDASHFHSVAQGNGVDHMNIYLLDIPPDMLQVGDELGVFDNNICVGGLRILNTQPQIRNLSIPSSADDGSGEHGFTIGNKILLKIWKSSENNEYSLEPEIIKGTSSFVKHESTFMSLANYNVTELDNCLMPSGVNLKIYPNPTDGKVYINYYGNSFFEITVLVVNVRGEQILSQVFKTNPAVVNLTGLAKGVYNIKILGDNWSQTETVVLR